MDHAFIDLAARIASESRDPDARQLADAVLGIARTPTVPTLADHDPPVKVFGVLLARLADMLDVLDPPKSERTEAEILPTPMERLYAGHPHARAMLLRAVADALEGGHLIDHADLYSEIPVDMKRRMYRLPDDRMRNLLADRHRDARHAAMRERMRQLLKEMDECPPQGS